MPTFRAFITRYALSAGIQEVDATRSASDSSYVSYGDHGFVGPHDWHLDRARAVKRAEAMRDAKIKSLEAQLKKLRALKF